MKYTLIALLIHLTSPMVAAQNLVPVGPSACGEILDSGSLVIDHNAVALYRSPADVTLALNKEFRKLGAHLFKSAATQGAVIVNESAVKDVNLPPDAFQMLKAFHNNPRVGVKSKHHHLLIRSQLSFVSSQNGPDPGEPNKTVRLHTFKQEVTSELAIFGILIERSSVDTTRFAEMIVRFARNQNGKLTMIDIPMTYQYYGTYESLDDHMQIADKGLTHTFNVNLTVFDPKGRSLFSGAQAELTNSQMHPNSLHALVVNIWAVK